MKCQRCNGAGQVENGCWGNYRERFSICRNCNGTGKVPDVLLARARAEAKDEAHTCKWQGTRFGCAHNADAAYVATVMEIADGEAV